MVSKLILRCGGAIGALFIAAPALAQTADGQVGLGEIVVTAQKRAQDLQEVPAAVTAITAGALEDRGISETSDLMGALPNLQVTSAYGRTQPNFSLRGISVANEFSASTASPVGVYVDEVYQSFRASHGQQLYDLERVEVVRGPQGTLYGRNTTGGAVNFITRRPSLSGSSGSVTLGYGNFDTFTAEAAGETTFIPDQFGVRIAGTFGSGDGYTFNPTLNEDFATTDFQAGRLTALLRPTERLEIVAKVYTGENNPRQDIPYGVGYLEGRTNAAGYSREGLPEDVIEADTAGNYFTSATGATLTIEYEFSPRLSLTSVTGVDEGEYRLAPFDCDGSPLDICAIRYSSESEGINQDLRLTFEGDKLTLIGGLYYGRDEIFTHNEPDFFGFLQPLLLGAGVPASFFNAPIAGLESLRTVPAFAVNPALTPGDADFCAPIVINPDGFFDARSLAAFQYDVATTNSAFGTAAQAACAAAGAPPFQNILADQRFTLTRPSTAIYGEAAYEVTPRMSVTVGLRYTWDEVEYSGAVSTITNLGGETVAGLVPYSFPYDPSIPPVNQSESTGEFSGRVVLDYKLTDEVLTYASYSRGYRSGTYNGLAYQATEQVYFVEPETVNAYEIGLKSRFLEDTAQLNLAAFWYEYENQQIAEIVGATSFLRNANGRVWGVEAEGLWQATRSIRFDAALGYLDTRYDDDQRFRDGGLDIGGNEFPNAPNWTFSGGVDWSLWAANSQEIYLRTDAQYMGEYWFDPYNDYDQSPCNEPGPGQATLLATPELACANPGYWLFNARLTYETPKYAVSLWGKNLADEFYYVYGLNLNAFYQDYLTRGAPRTYGIELTAKF